MRADLVANRYGGLTLVRRGVEIDIAAVAAVCFEAV